MKISTLVSALAIAAGAMGTGGLACAMPGLDRAPGRGPSLIERTRIFCEPDGRCFRTDPWGRRIFVPRPFGFGRPGFDDREFGRPGFDGPYDGRPGFGRRGFDGPEFGRPGFGGPGFGEPRSGGRPGVDDRDGGRGNGRGSRRDDAKAHRQDGGASQPQGGIEPGQGQGGDGQPHRRRQPGARQDEAH